MIKIRKATKKDLKILSSFWLKEEKANEKYGWYKLRSNTPKWIKNYLKKRLGKNDFIAFITFENNKPIAAIHGWISDNPYLAWDIKKVGHIGSIFVEKGYRKKGIGRELFNELEKCFVSKGIEIFDLYVHSKNKIGVKTWYNLGYKDQLIYMIKK